MIESVKLDWTTLTITVTLEGGTSTDYFDAVSYLTDHPDREADVIAMGWSI